MLLIQVAKSKAFFFLCIICVSQLVSGNRLYELVPEDQDMFPLPNQDQDRRLTNTAHLHFYVMGDVPYREAERIRFPLQISSLDVRPDFLVHVGDMKKHSTLCTPENYKEMADMLKAHSRPTFVVLGDNDWFECEHRIASYNLWQKHLSKMERNWPTSGFQVEHQENRTENFAFVHNHVLVMGLHVVHASFNVEPMLYDIVEDTVSFFQSYFDLMTSDEIQAVVIFGHAFPFHPKFKAFQSVLMEAVVFATDTSFLYIQGDDHVFQVDNPLESPNNFLRVVVDRGGIADPLEVVVDTSSPYPFKLKRRPLSVL